MTWPVSDLVTQIEFFSCLRLSLSLVGYAGFSLCNLIPGYRWKWRFYLLCVCTDWIFYGWSGINCNYVFGCFTFDGFDGFEKGFDKVLIGFSFLCRFAFISHLKTSLCFNFCLKALNAFHNKLNEMKIVKPTISSKMYLIAF